MSLPRSATRWPDRSRENLQGRRHVLPPRRRTRVQRPVTGRVLRAGQKTGAGTTVSVSEVDCTIVRSPVHSAIRASRFAIDVRAAAARVRCPTLLLHSLEDHRVPFSCARELAQLLPDSRIVPLATRNHLLRSDEPAWQVFLHELNRFLPEFSR